MIHKSTITGSCPAGFCEYIQEYSVQLIVALCIDIFIFFVTLVPPLFNWSTKKPDGKKRIYFAALACITFYFWLIFLAVNSLYCFGFMAHKGPCVNQTRFESTSRPPTVESAISPTNIVVKDESMSSLDEDSNSLGKEKSLLKALPSISYRASETTSFRSKRQTESNLEHPPNTLPPFSLPTLSSSSSSFYTSSLGSSPSSSFINSLSSSSFVSSGTSPNRSYRDKITARKSNINSTSSSHSSQPTSFSLSYQNLAPSSSRITSLPSFNFSPVNNDLFVEGSGEDLIEYNNVNGASSYGIMAQALIGKDAEEDCITTTPPPDTPPPAIVEHETELKNLFYAHVLIFVLLFIVLVANAKEGKKDFCVIFPHTIVMYSAIRFIVCGIHAILLSNHKKFC